MPITYPSLEEILANTSVVSIPLKIVFRGIVYREAAIIRGPLGWGEFAPFLEYSDRESSRWLRAAIGAGWEYSPDPVRSSIRVNATLPAVGVDKVSQILANFIGVDTVKIKVAQLGQRLVDDIARVRKVRSVFPDIKIRVDANGGWSVAEAFIALDRLAEFEIEYVEQPVSSLEEVVQLKSLLRRRGVKVLCALDENIRKSDSPESVIQSGVADIVILKVFPLGGLVNCLRLAALADCPVVVSSALDTSVGIGEGLRLAASLPQLYYACGLGTANFLSTDVVNSPLYPENGVIDLRSIDVDADLLKRNSAGSERTLWWVKRISRSYKYLSEELGCEK